jgi:hypothetical protein
MNDERNKDDRKPYYKKDSQTGKPLNKYIYKGGVGTAKLIHNGDLKQYLDDGWAERPGEIKKNKGGRPPVKK